MRIGEGCLFDAQVGRFQRWCYALNLQQPKFSDYDDILWGNAMKFEEFEHQLVASAFVVAAATLMQAGGGISPLFALSLFALSQVGYFALAALKKSGQGSPNAEYLIVFSAVACFFAAAFSFSALQYAVPLLFFPLIFSTPALVGVAKTFLG